MISEFAGYISGILILIAFIPYIKDIFLNKTKPERGSWLIWSILGGIAFFSQLAKGASYSLILTGIQALGDTSVSLLSIKYGFGGLLKRDKIALLGAIISLIIWYFTKEAATALFLIIIIDGIGGILTIIKSYENPASETLSTWILTGLSGLFAAIAVGSLDFILLAFPIYIFLISFAIIVAMRFGSRNFGKDLIKKAI